MAIIKNNVSGNFNDVVTSFIIAGENFKDQIYLDIMQIPTIGYGFSLTDDDWFT